MIFEETGRSETHEEGPTHRQKMRAKSKSVVQARVNRNWRQAQPKIEGCANEAREDVDVSGKAKAKANAKNYV